MLELLDFAILSIIVLFNVLLAVYVSYKVVKPRLLRTVQGAGLAIGNQVSKSMAEAVENVDVGEMLGQIGGGESMPEGIGAVVNALGGSTGGVGDILGLLTKLGGKNKGGGGSSGW